MNRQTYSIKPTEIVLPKSDKPNEVVYDFRIDQRVRKITVKRYKDGEILVEVEVDTTLRRGDT